MRGFEKVISFALTMVILIITITACSEKIQYPETKKIPVIDTYHGTQITDNYRWLEDADDPEVVAWIEAQERLSHTIIDPLPQKQWLLKRLNELERYDKVDVPEQVYDGERIFVRTKTKDQDKWVYNTQINKTAEREVLIDPNEWDPTQTLHAALPSRDGKLLAYGVAHGGDENPIYRVMNVETGEILPDTLRGWKQWVTGWLPDHSGFYYSAKPLSGAVPEGEEFYWPAAYLHKLGTPASEDEKVFWHDEVKEYWHHVYVNEDGKYAIFNRSLFNQDEVFFKPAGSDKPLIPIATGFDAQYSVDITEDRILIRTDADAPLYKLFVTDVKKPQREYWKELIPEHEQDRLDAFYAIGGRLYILYQHNSYSEVKIYTLEGQYLRDIQFPTFGSAKISGIWTQPEVWIEFESFTYPATIFRYDFTSDSLIQYFQPDLEIQADKFDTRQVWYESKDGTAISMFIVHPHNLIENAPIPTLLYGYGGFNISINPTFRSYRVAWLEAGGTLALPNLRGGGEYGVQWHEAGMREKKQNVFDDFIAAAEWLIENDYTNSARLALYGGSNGGLLVGAFAVQRPELCKAIYCAVPLLDMVNYHSFGLANIWSEEYGSSEDPEQFKYIYAYSPYHHVSDGTKYPAMLITGSVNDARVDPLHARKMVARLQEADPDGNPTLLLERKASGHGGGTTVSARILQDAEEFSFLMNQVGLKAPGN